jgi:prophage regulatory protein
MARKIAINEVINPMTGSMRHLVAQKHLRLVAVRGVTGLSRSSIYGLMAKGTFPRPVRLTTKAVAWRESEIAEWLEQRPKTDAS